MGDADAAYLEAFLASRKRPEGTLLYYELEGFLFAVACSPDLVMPSEWTPLIFAEKEAGYADGGTSAWPMPWHPMPASQALHAARGKATPNTSARAPGGKTVPPTGTANSPREPPGSQ